MRVLFLILTLLAQPAFADPPGTATGSGLGAALSAPEFNAYATGKTLIYAADGAVWGSEQYLSGHRVLWAFTGQPCEYGTWYDDAGAICFLYEGKPDPNCWHFYHGERGLIAQFVGGNANNALSEVGQSAEPMNCPGPKVGV